MSTCLSILNDGVSPKDLNQTFIVLIPKKKNTEQSSNFRPISLCNVVFKIITKAITNRIKRFLTLIIDPCLSVFVLGRLITDNALIAFEIFHAMNLNK